MASAGDKIEQPFSGHVESPPLDDLIDRVADEFEQTWTPDSILRLDRILDAIPESGRGAVRDELLALEFEVCFKKGFSVDPDHYVKRFPNFETEIKAVYENVMTSRRLGDYEYYEIIGKGGMGNEPEGGKGAAACADGKCISLPCQAL
jgi:hypothetical protein